MKKKIFRIAVVGGDWGKGGGRPSSYIGKLAGALSGFGNELEVHNGGRYPQLAELLDGRLAGSDAIVWMANVPNELPKIRDVKIAYPHTLFVSSKRNNSEYTFQALINRALLQKANLCIDFRRNGGVVSGRLFDPLGVVWQDYTSDIPILAHALSGRLHELKLFTRERSEKLEGTAGPVPPQPEFFALVKDYGKIFHSLVMPEEGVTRFLGNASFRGKDGRIYVSRRNVDKRTIHESSFVEVEYRGDGMVYYFGDHKPSVDSPIQVRLYRELPNINFMLHAHVYLENTPMTKYPVPCGALEEVKEVLSLISDTNVGFARVNLMGHGCIVFANRASKLEHLRFVARPMPEFMHGARQDRTTNKLV